MADVTVIPANMSLRADTVTILVQLGETVTAGTMLYQKESDSKYYLADADDAGSDPTPLEVAGDTDIVLCITGGVLDEYVIAAETGDVDVGGTVVKGTTYFLSATGGGVWGDTVPATGDYSTRLGVAMSTSVITLDLFASGNQVP